MEEWNAFSESLDGAAYDQMWYCGAYYLSEYNAPGDAIAGVRLRRVSRQGARPGWAAIYRAALLVLATAATAGIAPLVFFLRIVFKGRERSWLDRLAGTVMLSSAAASGTACSLVCDGVLIALTGPTVVGRQPSQIASHPDARLVPILVDDSSVSKTHALLVPTLHGVMITDLDSTYCFIL